jgi:DHA1 family tetracycline resistance protein-like MFS transporter
VDRKTRKAAVSFIFVTILLDAIGLGLLIPVLPDVLRRFSSDHAVVSEYFGYFVGVYAFMQFVASPVLGALSDRYGRRSILLSSLLGAGLDYIFMAFAPSLSLLFLGRMIAGLTGASMTVASSYMADISTDENRSSNFGMIGAAWGVGFILGPILGGLLGSLGPTAPFLAAAVLNIVNFVYGLLLLPESLPPEKRRHVELKSLNPLRSVWRILQASEYVGLVWIYFLMFLAGQIHPVNWTLYTETKFGWTPWQVGLSLSFVGVNIALAQGYLVRKIVPKLGERKALTVGLFISTTAFFLFGVASEGWMMYAITVYFALSGITMPSLQSLLVKHTPSNRQGELQGSLVSIGSVACILAPLIFTQIFVRFTEPGAPVYFPGAAYVGASCIGAIALFIRWIDRKA